MKVGNGSIPLRLGRLVNTKVYGGPFRDCPEHMFGVKMACEIDEQCDVSIPTRDFDVPIVSQLREGVVRALMAMINGQEVYAGCMGGIGRTGLFLAALAKVQIEYRKVKHRPGRGDDPVLYVRKHFIPHAVETDQQMKYIADLDVAGIVTWLCYTQSAMGMGGMTPARFNAAEEKKIARDRYEDGRNQSSVGERHRAAWKETIHDRKGEDVDQYFMQQTEEFIDTAADVLEDYNPTIEWSHIESLQNQIDELEEIVTQQHKLIEILNTRVSNTANSVTSLANVTRIGFEEALTKPTLFERIRTGFYKWINSSDYEGM